MLWILMKGTNGYLRVLEKQNKLFSEGTEYINEMCAASRAMVLSGKSEISVSNYRILTVSRFRGATVSILNILWIELAKSKHLDDSPWLVITFFGRGAHL